jgi:hypothetical protein
MWHRLLLRDKKAVKPKERLMLRYLARKFRKHVRFLLVDIGQSQCGGGQRGSQCLADLAAINQFPGGAQIGATVSPATYMVKELGTPMVPITSTGVAEMRKEIKTVMLLNVPELTSRTIEHLCPHELQRRVSQPASR